MTTMTKKKTPRRRKKRTPVADRRQVRGALGLGLLLLCLVVTRPAKAALTSSEEAQIKGFVASAQADNAARVRALVARPDLSADEAADSLSQALTPVAWTEPRAAFFHEMLFGGSSAAARPALVSATVRAVLARADAVLAKNAADLDQRPEAVSELLRLYGFLGTEIANAGRPQGNARDASTGIPPSTYDDCAKALVEHVQRNPRWLRVDAPLSVVATRVRAALELVLYEMTNDTPTRRVDAADRLGLTGARRAFLIEAGVLVLDAGKADDARVQKARALVDRLPSARVGVEAIYFGESAAWIAASLHPRGQVLGVLVPLEVTQAAAPLHGQHWEEEVEPGPLDLPLFMLAYELSLATVPRALDNRGDLRVIAEHDARQADGQPSSRSSMTTDQRLAGLMAQVLTDAPRTLDLAFGRWLRGQPETAALLSDAMGILAAFAPPGPPPRGLVLPLAQPKPDGELEPLPATNVHLFPNGAVSGFTLAGHRMELTRDSSGVVVLVRTNGTKVSLAGLPTARVPLSEGNAWSGEGVVFARFLGSPRASVGLGPRVRLMSSGTDALDAIATPSPADDFAADLDLTVRGEAGVMLRAATTRGAFQGVSVVIDASPGATPRASLRARTGASPETEIAKAVDLTGGPTYHVHVAIHGDKIDATVGDAKLTGTLPPGLAHGDLALRVAQGAALEANAWRVHK